MNRHQQLLAEALDTLPVNVAVLDREGVIRQTNHSWRTFGATNDIQTDPDTVGTNYLTVCERAGTDSALAVKRGLEAILAGRRETFEQVYPCHSPLEQRWYLLQAMALDRDDTRYAVVAHSNVTQQVLETRRVESQRDALAALDDLNTALRELTHAVLETPPQAELEAVVCETLAETDHYTCVQIGTVDARSDSFTVRATAGDCERIDSTAVTAEPATAESTPPGSTDTARVFGVTAIRQAVWTGQLQTTTQLVDNAAFDWRTDSDHPTENLALAAVPISHDGTTYGLCLLYSDRPTAFDADERAILGDLGTLVGHAVAAAERRQALMNETVIEVELRLSEFIPQPTPPPDDWRVEITHTVEASESGYNMFGTVEAADLSAVEAVFDPLAAFRLSLLGQQGETCRIRLWSGQECVIPLLASHGWSTESTTLANGDAYLTVRLPAGDSVRTLVETVAETVPNVELLARRQRHDTRPDPRTERVPVDTLTDRQQSVLETAYAAGYFEWPRDSSGEEVAETLGISPPTFHQHLRVGQQKLMDALFDSQSAVA